MENDDTDSTKSSQRGQDDDRMPYDADNEEGDSGEGSNSSNHNKEVDQSNYGSENKSGGEGGSSDRLEHSSQSEGSNVGDSSKDKEEFLLCLRGTKRKPRHEEVDSESEDLSGDPERSSYVPVSQPRRHHTSTGETSTRVSHASSQLMADKDENDEVKTVAYSSTGPQSSISSDSVIAVDRERVFEVLPHKRSRDAVIDTSSSLIPQPAIDGIIRLLESQIGGAMPSRDPSAGLSSQSPVSSLQTLTALLALLVSLYATTSTMNSQSSQYAVSSNSEPSSSSHLPIHQNPSSVESVNSLTSILALLVSLQSAGDSQDHPSRQQQPQHFAPTNASNEGLYHPQHGQHPPMAATAAPLATALGNAIRGIQFGTMSQGEIKAALLQHLTDEISALPRQQQQHPSEHQPQHQQSSEVEVPQNRLLQHPRQHEQVEQHHHQQQHQDKPVVDPLLQIARIFQSVYNQQRNNMDNVSSSGSDGGGGSAPQQHDISSYSESTLDHQAYISTTSSAGHPPPGRVPPLQYPPPHQRHHDVQTTGQQVVLPNTPLLHPLFQQDQQQLSQLGLQQLPPQPELQQPQPQLTNEDLQKILIDILSQLRSMR